MEIGFFIRGRWLSTVAYVFSFSDQVLMEPVSQLRRSAIDCRSGCAFLRPSAVGAIHELPLPYRPVVDSALPALSRSFASSLGGSQDTREGTSSPALRTKTLDSSLNTSTSKTRTPRQHSPSHPPHVLQIAYFNRIHIFTSGGEKVRLLSYGLSSKTQGTGVAWVSPGSFNPPDSPRGVATWTGGSSFDHTSAPVIAAWPWPLNAKQCSG